MRPVPKEIQALMPVLRSNFWLGIHVLTIVTSYAGALAAWVIANATLGCYLFGRYRVVPVCAAAARRIKATVLGEQESTPTSGWRSRSTGGGLYPTQAGRLRYVRNAGLRWPAASWPRLNYRVIQVTVLLLAAGTILGGLWANVSWGRFWGWRIPRKSAH